MKKALAILGILLSGGVAILFGGVLYTQAMACKKSSIDISKFAEIRNLEFLAGLAVENTEYLKSDKLTEISVGGRTYPLYAFTINGNGTTDILLTGSIHGTEPAGAYALGEVIGDAVNYSEKYRDLRITVIPVMNPWGFANGSRTNNEGINVGLDFNHSESMEAKSIKNYLDRKTFDLVIDFHEDAGKRSYLLVNEGKDIPEGSAVIEKLDAAGILLAKEPTKLIFRMFSDPYGIAFYPPIASFFQRLSDRETLFVYLLNRGMSKKSIAVETGKANDIGIRKKIDRIVLDEYLKTYRMN